DVEVVVRAARRAVAPSCPTRRRGAHHRQDRQTNEYLLHLESPFLRWGQTLPSRLQRFGSPRTVSGNTQQNWPRRRGSGPRRSQPPGPYPSRSSTIPSCRPTVSARPSGGFRRVTGPSVGGSARSLIPECAVICRVSGLAVAFGATLAAGAIPWCDTVSNRPA